MSDNEGDGENLQTALIFDNNQGKELLLRICTFEPAILHGEIRKELIKRANNETIPRSLIRGIEGGKYKYRGGYRGKAGGYSFSLAVHHKTCTCTCTCTSTYGRMGARDLMRVRLNRRNVVSRTGEKRWWWWEEEETRSLFVSEEVRRSRMAG